MYRIIELLLPSIVTTIIFGALWFAFRYHVEKISKAMIEENSKVLTEGIKESFSEMKSEIQTLTKETRKARLEMNLRFYDIESKLEARKKKKTKSFV